MSVRPTSENPRRRNRGEGPVLVQGCGLSALYVLADGGWQEVGAAAEWRRLDGEGAGERIATLRAKYEKARAGCDQAGMMGAGLGLALSEAKRMEFLTKEPQHLGRRADAELRDEFDGPRFFATPRSEKALGEIQQREVAKLVPDFVACEDWGATVDVLMGSTEVLKEEYAPLTYRSVATSKGGRRQKFTDITQNTRMAAYLHVRALLVRAADVALEGEDALNGMVVDRITKIGGEGFKRADSANRFLDRWFGDSTEDCAQLERAAASVGSEPYSHALVTRYAVVRRCRGADAVAAAMLSSKQVDVRKVACNALRHSDNPAYQQKRKQVAQQDPDSGVRRRCGPRS